ncbi:MAG: DUF362 domain-containing protein [Desulfobulbaceae bacterium]
MANEMRKVYLDRCPGYASPRLDDCLATMLAEILPSGPLRQRTVLLKPNCISVRGGLLACTEPSFILAAARWFVDQGARVRVGDSPAFGTAAQVFRKMGIEGELRRMSVGVADFGRARRVELPSGLRVGMAAEALDCDLLVNLPRVKAHAQMRVTLGVKNLFGCVVGMRKPIWHMVHGGDHGSFAEHLVELLEVLGPTTTLVDGITAMHRTGPIGGEPYPLHLVAGGEDPVAVDRALLEILAVPPESSPLMGVCLRSGNRSADLASLDFPHRTPAELAVDSFIVPERLSPVRFNPFRFLRSGLRRMWLKVTAPSS